MKPTIAKQAAVIEQAIVCTIEKKCSGKVTSTTKCSTEKKKKLALALCIGYKHTQLKKKRVWELFIFCIYISVCVCVNDIQELSSFVSSVHILIHLARCHSVCLASVVIFIYYIYILLLQVFSSHFSLGMIVTMT